MCDGGILVNPNSAYETGHLETGKCESGLLVAFSIKASVEKADPCYNANGPLIYMQISSISTFTGALQIMFY